MFTQIITLGSASWFPWLLDILLKSIALLALAGFATLACRRASASQRHLIWTMAVVGVLLLPVLSAVMPVWNIIRLPEWQPPITLRIPASSAPSTPSLTPIPFEVPPARPDQSGTSAATPISPGGPPARPDLSGSPVAATPHTSSPASAPMPIVSTAPSRQFPALPWLLLVMLAWGVGGVLIFARWGYGYVVTRRLLAHARPVTEAWTFLMAEVAGTAHVRLLMSDHVAIPVVVGIIRPTILLPAQAEEWPEERRRVVLLHELAHIRRGDLPVQVLAQLACVLYWVNPLVWLAAHRLRIEREVACDDAVLLADVRPSDYAEHLLAVAGALPERRLAPIAGIAMAQSSNLGRRITGLLDPRRNRHTLTWWGIALLLLITLPVVGLLAQTSRPESSSPQTVPAFTPIPLPAIFSPKSFVVSPDGQHVAFISTELVMGKQVVVLDGQAGPPYACIGAPFELYDDLDGSHETLPQDMTSPGIFFSPDGRHVAYLVNEKPPNIAAPPSRAAVAIDGKAGPYFDSVTTPQFSPNSKHVAYIAHTGEEFMVVCDGIVGTPYDEINNGHYGGPIIDSEHVLFSADGERMAYAAKRDNQWQVVVDGAESAGYEDVSGLTFSPDSRHFVYIASRGDGKSLVITDGHEGNAYGFAAQPVYSPDSHQLAYLAGSTWENPALVINDQTYPEYRQVSSICFSPDSRRIATLQREGVDKQTMIVDGKQVLTTSEIIHFGFSQDSRHVACVSRAFEGGHYKYALTVDGVTLPYQTAEWLPVYSPDGTRMAAIVNVAGKQAVLVDGKVFPTVDGEIRGLRFSPDGKHIIYEVDCHTNRATSDIVLDGVAGPTYQRILSVRRDMFSDIEQFPAIPRTFFDASDRFHYFAITDGMIQRVDVNLSEQPVTRETPSEVSSVLPNNEGEEWNDFTTTTLAPSYQEAATSYFTNSPRVAAMTIEAGKALAQHLRGIKGIESCDSHLLPMKKLQREGSITGWQPSDVFLVRHKVGPNWLQITSDGICYAITIARVDGTPLQEGAFTSADMLRFVGEWLPRRLMPASNADIQTFTDKGTETAKWLTEEGSEVTVHTPDSGVYLRNCEVFQENGKLCFLFDKYIPGSYFMREFSFTENWL